jgi:SNF2 family DNA or RNA helicase
MGQSRPCLFVDLMAQGSIDERIMDVIERKQDMAQGVLNWIRDYRRRR